MVVNNSFLKGDKMIIVGAEFPELHGGSAHGETREHRRSDLITKLVRIDTLRRRRAHDG
jgi:hypothetical protein